VPNKTAHPEEQSTSNPSTAMPPEKHITPSHPSTRQDRSLKGRRKLSLTHGTVTTAYHSTLTTDTTPHLSPLGAATDITRPLKATSPRAMDTPEGMMKSPLPSPTKPNAWTIPYYGPTRLKRASSKPQTGWTPVVDMGSHSTRRSFALLKTKLNSQASKLPMTPYVHARGTDFPTPQSLTDIRSWFGLVNQVSYAFSMADTMLPFQELLKPSNSFHWDEKLQQAFQQSKLTIINKIHNGVKILDKTKPMCLATDWSKQGIGYWLFQKHCSCPSNDLFCCKQGWKITLVGSRFTHAAESRYAPIEGEALAVADALDKARHFVLGCKNLTVAVDHQPLLKIFGDRSLNNISNTRLRNLKDKTWYDIASNGPHTRRQKQGP